MFRFAFKRFTLLRKFSCTSCRLEDVHTINQVKIVSQVKPSITEQGQIHAPPHTKPFEELKTNDEKESVENNDIGEFVDSLGPPLPVSFNLAAFVNRSESLQNLVRLGVDLSYIENNPEAAKFILNLDFETDMKKHIQFLHDNGVVADKLGYFITKNPFIFKESLEDLEVRINYLESKKFMPEAISAILTRNPRFLSCSTKRIDTQLGFLQKQFELTGDEVRFVTVKYPKLMTLPLEELRVRLFTVREELGFNPKEMKALLLSKPRLYTETVRSLKERFDVLHNLMGFSHERLLEYPSILCCRSFKIKQRHLYLEHLNKAQYDPELPLYVSLQDLTILPDAVFCEKYAKTSVEKFNDFLKTI